MLSVTHDELSFIDQMLELDPSRSQHQITPAFDVSEQFVMLPDATILDALKNDEYGDARLLCVMLRGRLIYDHSDERWYVWGGHAWIADRTGAIHIVASEQLPTQYAELATMLEASLPADHDNTLIERDKKQQQEIKIVLDYVNQLRRRVKQLKATTRTTKILKAASFYRATTADQWDADPWLLPVQNGVIELRSGTFRPGRLDDLIRTVAPVMWTGLDTLAPRWEQFLASVLPDALDVLAFFQIVLGYAITGSIIEHKFFVLYGSGRNGKGTIVETLFALLHGIAGPVSPDVLIATRGRTAGAATPHLVDLQGKRIAVASETNEGVRIDHAQLKNITGGDTITARQLHGKQYSFAPTHTLFLMTNDLPHANADDQALWDRMVAIPFLQRFVDDPQAPNEHQRDPALKDALLSEASGILAWLVRGCLAWQRDGLRVPAFLQLATDEYRRSEDEIADFLADRCIVEHSATIGAAQFLKLYQAWADEMNLSSRLNGRKFRERMLTRFKQGRKGPGMVWLGVRARRADESLPMPDDNVIV